MCDAKVTDAKPEERRGLSNDSRCVETYLRALGAVWAAYPENDGRVLHVAETTVFASRRLGDAEEGGAAALEQREHVVTRARMGDSGLRQEGREWVVRPVPVL